MKLIILLFNVLFISLASTVLANKYNVIDSKLDSFDPTWKSLDSRPLPTWYDEAKVGIFMHWGVYSVPSFGSEWFWQNWRGTNATNYEEFMIKNFKPGFTYQEFAPQFTAEHFNATDWVNIFKKSGAKYVVLTSKHHEGFTLWPSTYSFSWNSMDVGPHRDLVGELAEAVRENSSIHFGLYYSLFEWFNPLYLRDKLHLFFENNFSSQKTIPELKELVNRYHPEVIWSDGEWEAPDNYWGSKEFLAWLYNESPVRETVVTNDRWGLGTLCVHGGYHTCTDRYNPGVLQEHKWENAMTIDKHSWGHRANAKLEEFLTSKELISELVSTVSCGGNLLVNVGPNSHGIIEPIFVERLYAMGHWLDNNGEAIYASIPWKVQNDTVTSGVWYTTRKPDGDRQIIYAMVLDWPVNNAANLFAPSPYVDDSTKINLLGYDKPLTYSNSKLGTLVNFPEKHVIDRLGLDLAWTLRIDIPAHDY